MVNRIPRVRLMLNPTCFRVVPMDIYTPNDWICFLICTLLGWRSSSKSWEDQPSEDRTNSLSCILGCKTQRERCDLTQEKADVDIIFVFSVSKKLRWDDTSFGCLYILDLHTVRSSSPCPGSVPRKGFQKQGFPANSMVDVGYIGESLSFTMNFSRFCHDHHPLAPQIWGSPTLPVPAAGAGHPSSPRPGGRTGPTNVARFWPSALCFNSQGVNMIQTHLIACVYDCTSICRWSS